MRAQGLTVAALDRMPQLAPWHASIVRAHNDLRGDRSFSGALSWSACMRYARAVGLDGFWLYDVLQNVDAEVSEWQARKSTSPPSLPASRLKSTQ
jgi:hypothetical protein